MSGELLSPIVALAGVIISILASAFVSSRQSKLEVKKLRTGLQMTYVSKLIDKRLEAYPALFKPISEFEENLKNGIRRKSSADKLLKMMLASKVEFDEHVSTKENRDSIVLQIREFEIALKQDLGVYVIDFPDVDNNISSYAKVSELVHNSKRKSS